MTLKQYRFADAMIFIILAFASSFISEYVYHLMPLKFYYFNLSMLVSLILIVRWGFVGAIAFAVSGIPVLLYRGGSADMIFQVSFYILANLGIGLSILTFKWMNKNKIGHTFIHTLIYLLIAFTGLIILKGLFFIFIGVDPIQMSIQFFWGEAFNMIITVVLFLIIGKLSDGLIGDMTDYILTLQREKEQI